VGERERGHLQRRRDQKFASTEKRAALIAARVPRRAVLYGPYSRPYYLAALPEFKFWLRNRGFLLAGRCDLAQKSRQHCLA